MWYVFTLSPKYQIFYFCVRSNRFIVVFSCSGEKDKSFSFRQWKLCYNYTLFANRSSFEPLKKSRAFFLFLIGKKSYLFLFSTLDANYITSFFCRQTKILSSFFFSLLEKLSILFSCQQVKKVTSFFSSMDKHL